MTSTSALPSASLYCQQNGSDKVYHLKLVSKAGGFIVECAWGRRGGNMATGTKPSDGQPVPREKAQKLFDALLKEKRGKGYTEAAGQAAFSGTDDAGRVSGLLPQLLNEIDEASFVPLISDDRFLFQEKMDGNRVMLRKLNGKIEAVNRKGLTIGFPEGVAKELALSPGDSVLDGEMIGDNFWAFDILAAPTQPNVVLLGTEQRHRILQDFIDALEEALPAPLLSIHLVPSALTAADKEALYKSLLARGAEGVVAKLKDAPYTPGRPASGGPQLKRKFVETATVRVARINTQRSVLVEVLADDGATWTRIGNVTVPPNKAIPEIGSLIEVRYLYAYKGGNLIQPSFLGLRTDATEEDCSIAQLKYKSGTA